MEKRKRGLGKNQQDLIRQLQGSDDLCIRLIHDYRRQSVCEYYLEDYDGVNTYDKLRPELVESLNKREYFDVEEFNPCLGMDIITFKLKKEYR